MFLNKIGRIESWKGNNFAHRESEIKSTVRCEGKFVALMMHVEEEKKEICKIMRIGQNFINSAFHHHYHQITPTVMNQIWPTWVFLQYKPRIRFNFPRSYNISIKIITKFSSPNNLQLNSSIVDADMGPLAFNSMFGSVDLLACVPEMYQLFNMHKVLMSPLP